VIVEGSVVLSDSVVSSIEDGSCVSVSLSDSDTVMNDMSQFVVVNMKCVEQYCDMDVTGGKEIEVKDGCNAVHHTGDEIVRVAVLQAKVFDTLFDNARDELLVPFKYRVNFVVGRTDYVLKLFEVLGLLMYWFVDLCSVANWLQIG
jgi:hypothetical protein